MRVFDVLRLSGDNLRRTKLRTTLTATGIAIGTAAVVTLLAFGNGAQALAVGRAASFGAVTTVTVRPAETNPKPLTPAVVSRITTFQHVSRAVVSLSTPQLRLQVAGKTLEAPGTGQGPIADGVPMVFGAGGGSAENDGVLVPKSTAGKLGLTSSSVGSGATVTIGGDVCCPSSRGGLVYAGPDQAFTARIAGVWDDTSTSGHGDKAAASPLILAAPLAARVSGAASGTSGDGYLASAGYDTVQLITDDARATGSVASQVKALGFDAQDRADLLKQVDLVFNLIRAALGMVGGIALLVAAIGIANTLIMTVLERTREIGIMKALGAEPGSVRAIFLCETALVGLIGGMAGLALSAAGSAVGNIIFVRIVQSQNPDFPATTIFQFNGQLLLFGVAIAVLVSLLGGALPSRRAVRLQPLDALRYE